MDIELLFGVIATLLSILAFSPYIRDIFLLKTKPHAYTWLIWILTQGTAVTAIWVSGGKLGALSMLIGLFLMVGIFLFSLKYGTKNITRSDKIILMSALLAIIIWWQLDNIVLAVILVSMIDLIGYVPTFRKSYFEPWSETVFSWVIFGFSNIFSILALAEYNFLTLFYLVAVGVANFSFFVFCLIRRNFIKRPKSHY